MSIPKSCVNLVKCCHCLQPRHAAWLGVKLTTMMGKRDIVIRILLLCGARAWDEGTGKGLTKSFCQPHIELKKSQWRFFSSIMLYQIKLTATILQASFTGKHIKDIVDPQAFSKAYLQKIFQMYLPGKIQPTVISISMSWKLCVKTCPDLTVLGWSGTSWVLSRTQCQFLNHITRPPNSTGCAVKPFAFWTIAKIFNWLFDWVNNIAHQILILFLKVLGQSCVSSANSMEWKYLWRMFSFNHDPL